MRILSPEVDLESEIEDLESRRVAGQLEQSHDADHAEHKRTQRTHLMLAMRKDKGAYSC